MKSDNRVLNFSDWYENYHSAYKYICKSDTQVCYSKHHPDLKDVWSPVTKKSTQANIQNIQQYLKGCRIYGCLLGMQRGRPERSGKLYLFKMW